MATNYLEVLKMLAAIGLGWSALPRTLIDDSLKVVHIKKTGLKRELGIVTHGARTLSNAAEAMIRTITAAT
jgi:DNA-binding transcriptional LysR family regulator